MALIPGRTLVVERELVTAPGTYQFLCRMQDRSWNLEVESTDTTGLDCDDPAGEPVVNTADPVAVNRVLSVTVAIDTEHEAVREMMKDIFEGRIGRYRITQVGMIQMVGLYMVSGSITAPVKGPITVPVTLTPTAGPESMVWQGAFA